VFYLIGHGPGSCSLDVLPLFSPGGYFAAYQWHFSFPLWDVPRCCSNLLDFLSAADALSARGADRSGIGVSRENVKPVRLGKRSLGGNYVFGIYWIIRNGR